jgi:hypothetical protein
MINYLPCPTQYALFGESLFFCGNGANVCIAEMLPLEEMDFDSEDGVASADFVVMSCPI